MKHYKVILENKSEKSKQVCLFASAMSFLSPLQSDDQIVDIKVWPDNYDELKRLWSLSQVTNFEIYPSNTDYHLRIEDAAGNYVGLKTPHEFDTDVSVGIILEVPLTNTITIEFDIEQVKTDNSNS